MPVPTTMFAKVWAAHEVAVLPGDVSLLYVDRDLIHDLEAGPDLARLTRAGRRVPRPDLTFATPNHAVASAPGRVTDTNATGGRLLREMRRRCADAGIRLFDLGRSGQGIVHVIGPELGMAHPGMLIVCADSHTCTHGGMGALAFGVGASEATHVLATQTIRQRRPGTMKIRFEGRRSSGVTAKDMVLDAIGRLGVAAGRGYALEWAGAAVAAHSVEERLTLCNMSIEMGAKIGMIAPDHNNVRIPRRPADGAFGSALRSGGGLLANAAERSRRGFRRRARARCHGSDAADRLGHESRAGGGGSTLSTVAMTDRVLADLDR